MFLSITLSNIPCKLHANLATVQISQLQWKPHPSRDRFTAVSSAPRTVPVTCAGANAYVSELVKKEVFSHTSRASMSIYGRPEAPVSPQQFPKPQGLSVHAFCFSFPSLFTRFPTCISYVPTQKNWVLPEKLNPVTVSGIHRSFTHCRWQLWVYTNQKVCVLLHHFNPLLALTILNIYPVPWIQVSGYKAQDFEKFFSEIRNNLTLNITL